MTTRKSAEKREKRITCKIPVAVFEKYEGASPEEKRKFNKEEIKRELRKEARIVRDLARRGILNRGNGVEIFGRTCERRLLLPHCGEVRFHSRQVRDFAKRIALRRVEVKKEGDKKGEPVSTATLRVIANTAGNHDIGKTLISEYLLNRENGTEDGRGARRIDFLTELPILRESHVEAGMSLLELYRPYIDKTEYRLMRLIIGGHHIAYDGIGTAMAPSYPERVGPLVVSDEIESENGIVTKNKLAVAQKIIRTADVFSAILENRKYLNESERLIEQIDIKGVTNEDKVLGLLITVAGIDADPKMVSILMMCMYEVSFKKAYGVVERFRHEDPKKLSIKGEDIGWACKRVLKRRRFLNLGRMRNIKWREKIDTGEFLSVGQDPELASEKKHEPI
jgi:hypothetical protein